MTAPDSPGGDPGDVYERIAEHGQVTVPADHAGQSVCVINTRSLAIEGYRTVADDGTIEVTADDGTEVEIVLPAPQALAEVEGFDSFGDLASSLGGSR